MKAMADDLQPALLRLQDTARTLGYPIGEEVVAALAKWARLVLEWRRRAQLTAIRSAAQVVSDLMEPALYAVQVAAVDRAGLVVDFGCGSGCTGLVLAVATGAHRTILMDRDEKKVVYCRYALAQCGIRGVEACGPEGLAGLGGAVDLVLARALPRDGSALKEAASLLRVDGTLVRWTTDAVARPGSQQAPCGASGLWVCAEPKQCFT